MDKPNYYSIIPADVRYDKRLTPNAKLLYAEITSLTNKEGVCWASDNYFMKLYGVEKRTVQSWLKLLEDNGYILRQVQYKENTKQIEKRFIRVVNINALGYGINIHKGMEYKCVDNNTSINNTSINSIYEQKPDFDAFWEYYPKKRNKGQAEKVFKKMVTNQETLDLIINDLFNRKSYQGWLKENGKFIPYPSTYLNAKGWLDEIDYNEPQQESTNEFLAMLERGEFD